MQLAKMLKCCESTTLRIRRVKPFISASHLFHLIAILYANQLPGRAPLIFRALIIQIKICRMPIAWAH